jgi:hypothetical protein
MSGPGAVSGASDKGGFPSGFRPGTFERESGRDKFKDRLEYKFRDSLGDSAKGFSGSFLGVRERVGLKVSNLAKGVGSLDSMVLGKAFRVNRKHGPGNGPGCIRPPPSLSEILHRNDTDADACGDLCQAARL